MTPLSPEETFMIWTSDHTVFGPLDLRNLVDWARNQRILPGTWVLAQKQMRWCRAEALEPLTAFFPSHPVRSAGRPLPDPVALARELKQFPAFASLPLDQLQLFVQFGDLLEAPPGRLLIRQNDESDAFFFLLSGEARSRRIIGNDDQTLGLIKPGECFGEMAMFTHTPRSADVLAQTDVRLLRLTSEACPFMMNQLPNIAAPILYAVAAMIASRILAAPAQLHRELPSQIHSS